MDSIVAKSNLSHEEEEPPSPFQLQPKSMLRIQTHLETESPQRSLEVISTMLEEEELNPPIDTFKEDIEYYLCCSGYFIGFGNFVTFPSLVFQNGGAAFLIPYTIAVVIVVIPAFVIETAWGQLIRSKLSHKYSMLNPRFWGVGLAILSIVSMTMVHYAVLFPWSLSFFIDSFRSPLPWSEEGKIWNPEYFHQQVLQRSESIDSAFTLIPRMLILLFVSYVIIYFTVRNGLSTSRQIVYYTVPIPIFLLAILLIKGVTLEGSELGFYYLFVPEWERLLDLKIWEKAFAQSIFQVGLAYGPILLYATARRPEAKVIWASTWQPFFDYVLSLLAACSLFSFLGHVSFKTEVDIQEISNMGVDLAFIAYPGLMSTLGFPNLWTALFFLMMMLIGIDSIFGQFDFAIAYCWDEFPWLKQRLRKDQFALIITAFSFMCGILFVTNNGWWYFLAFNHQNNSSCVVFVLASEMYIVANVLGFEKLDAILFRRTGEVLPFYLKICIRYVSLPLMLLVVLLDLYSELVTVRESKWVQSLERTLLAIPIFFVFIGLCYKKRRTPTLKALVKKQLGTTVDKLVAKLKEEDPQRSWSYRMEPKSPSTWKLSHTSRPRFTTETSLNPGEA